MRPVFIVGVAMTRFGDHSDRSIKDLAAEAVTDAMKDAACAQRDIEAIWYANAGQGAMDDQHMIRGQVALRPMGFDGLPIVNVENACASGSTALREAMTFIRAGGDVALAVGAEKLVSSDKARSLGVFDAGMDVSRAEEQLAQVLALGGDAPAFGGRRSIFMEIYAAIARQHMRLFGTTEREIAAVSAKNHAHSVENPRAHFRRAFSIDEVLAARLVAPPLTLPMCSPVSDGAAAIVVCSEAGARRMGALARAVRLDACVLRSGVTRDPDDFDRHIGRLTALDAYERAGIAPADVDVAEVHDAAAIAEIIQVENLGLARRGEGGRLALSGATSLGGRTPVNPSGGLESKGHPLGATGLAQVFEIVAQLRGEALARQAPEARVGVAENGGGFWGVEEAVCVVSVMTR